MKYPYDKIQKLRSEGKTYTEINQHLKLSIPRSSLSHICKNIPLPDNYAKKVKILNKKHLIMAREAAVLAAKSNFKVKYSLALVNAKKQIGKINKDEALLALAMLYLGEGSKRSSFRGLRLGSSDPQIVKLYINLLKIVFGVDVNDMRVGLGYRYNQDINLLKDYWSNITGISKDHFYNTIPDPRTIGKPTKKTDYMGVCAIYSSGADKQLFLQAYSEEFSNKLNKYIS